MIIKEEIEIDRLIAYNRQKSAQMINFLMCICALISIITINWLWPVAPVKQPGLKPVNDTIYTYCRVDNGYIRFAKPKDVDYNSFPEHSKIP